MSVNDPLDTHIAEMVKPDAKTPFASPKSVHVHAFTPHTLTYTAAGHAKLTVVCVCGAFKHVDAFDVDAPKSEA